MIKMKDTIKTRLEAVPITSLTKSFYRQRIPKYTSKRKETVDIEILITSKNGDKNRVTYQNND